jgi:hypothetical protein
MSKLTITVTKVAMLSSESFALLQAGDGGVLQGNHI